MDWECPNLTPNFVTVPGSVPDSRTSRICHSASRPRPLDHAPPLLRVGKPGHRACAQVALGGRRPGRGPERGVPSRGRGRGSWRRVLAGREPEVQTSCFSPSQAEPVRLGPAAAKELSPAPTVVAAHSLAHAAARGASFPRVPLLGVPATCARPAGPARFSDVRQGVHVGPEERRLGRGEGLCGQGERGCAEVAGPRSPERARS